MVEAAQQWWWAEAIVEYGIRWCPQARFFNHKIIKSYLSRPKKGMIVDLAGVPETIIFL